MIFRLRLRFPPGKSIAKIITAGNYLESYWGRAWDIHLLLQKLQRDNSTDVNLNILVSGNCKENQTGKKINWNTIITRNTKTMII